MGICYNPLIRLRYDFDISYKYSFKFNKDYLLFHLKHASQSDKIYGKKLEDLEERRNSKESVLQDGQ